MIGCGSVSHSYLPHLARCPHVELVSACDLLPDRTRAQAAKFGISHHYPHIDKMLAGAAFDLLVNLTDMQEHERLNRQAIEAGKHVWSEKPLANSLAAGRDLLALARKSAPGAPAMVVSPQFAFMAKPWRRASSAGWPPPTPTTATPGRTGRRSSTRRAAAARRTWRSTT
ncbi:MAG: Gfo/Idh/MocA family oxidoreductase [Gemmataceae bacterium]